MPKASCAVLAALSGAGAAAACPSPEGGDAPGELRLRRARGVPPGATCAASSRPPDAVPTKEGCSCGQSCLAAGCGPRAAAALVRLTLMKDAALTRGGAWLLLLALAPLLPAPAPAAAGPRRAAVSEPGSAAAAEGEAT